MTEYNPFFSEMEDKNGDGCLDHEETAFMYQLYGQLSTQAASGNFTQGPANPPPASNSKFSGIIDTLGSKLKLVFCFLFLNFNKLLNLNLIK